jgi:hypothetical protein
MKPQNRNATVGLKPDDHPTASRIQPDVISGGNGIPSPTRRHDRERLERSHLAVLPNISYHE